MYLLYKLKKSHIALKMKHISSFKLIGMTIKYIIACKVLQWSRAFSSAIRDPPEKLLMFGLIKAWPSNASYHMARWPAVM